jgi:hypothetical protein
MIIADVVKVAIAEFEAKMHTFGQHLNTQRLTAELAQQVSHALEEAFSTAGRTALKGFLESYDLQEPQLTNDGQTLRFKMVSPKTFLTRFGLIEIVRALYQADRGGQTYAPLDHFWDMNGHFSTLDVREAICLALSHMTASESAQLFSKCSLFRPSATAIQHVAEKVHDEIVPQQTALEVKIQEQLTVPKESRVLVASMDGVNVPLREPGATRGRPAERPGQEADAEKQSCYKNAMVGTISFYGDVPDDQESPERLRGVTLARMPQSHAVTFKDKFEHHLAAFEHKASPEITKVFLCDGHRTLWNYADQQECYDDYEKLIDFYHTEEHLSKAAEALFGKRNARAQAWYNRYRVKLLEQEDGVASVRRSMVYYSQTQRLSKSRQEALAKEQTFFRRNQHRMNYADFRVRGLPIGSGPVEAACKSIVKTRLCRSGMRWSRQGGQRILDFRCYAKCDLWKEFWDAYKAIRKSA